MNLIKFANLFDLLCYASLRKKPATHFVYGTASLVFTELRLSLRDFALAKIVAITKTKINFTNYL
ncbi:MULTISPECIES: hypothetical protein [unclassified Campylobacter]|uniref:hypothetical protein n=1 Tax=unclassified Campylobacter TaxID=2593542 RepID=UPI0022E99E9B|nr:MULTISPECIES: hypothetical protein [unclassified Campylobacter]MDA3055799.1 hypothetical protein [Campylobacter sp. CN_NA1]MDA3065915.1 hypothetical protein [Campylobacter sp. CN_NE4]MDA3068655.1 hypothetical protein [Campylobacter sp. CN_NE3]MDA3082022.1 hypothetical protein [Campylobacter sp. CN_EL2]MDA3084240.1 hypothetical protein [Campylobacter sp. CN_NE1]